MASSPTLATPPARAPKLLIAALVAVSLCAVALATYAITRGQPATAEPAAVQALDKPIFVTLEPLTVNVQTEGRSRFLHVGVALKVRDEQAKAQIVEFKPELV